MDLLNEIREMVLEQKERAQKMKGNLHFKAKSSCNAEAHDDGKCSCWTPITDKTLADDPRLMYLHIIEKPEPATQAE